MLSILIPVHNYPCYELVRDLHGQCTDLRIRFEIIVADDASDEASKAGNRAIDSLSHCRFIECKENRGRARTMNFLGEQAGEDYLLFMDCDGKVTRPDFIRRYIDARDEAGVIIGGLCNPDTLPSPDFSLRYTYERTTLKSRRLEDRNKNPFAQFTTFCFLIRRDVFLANLFDDSFTKYGYEDVAFGRSLQQHHVSVRYIDNPLCHMGLDDNKVYLGKIHTSIESLLEHREQIGENVQLLTYYNKVRKAGLALPLSLFYAIFQHLLRRNLLGRHPSMFLFSVYKLAYLCHAARKAK